MTATTCRRYAFASAMALAIAPCALALDYGEPIVAEGLVDAPRSEVWRAWTTSEGVESFFGPQANVDLRPGGPFEVLFMTDGPLGLRGADDCKILSFKPEEMLSFTWNAPPQYPNARREHTFVVLELEDAPGGETHVTLTHLGWPSNVDGDLGVEWQGTHKYFQDAWPSVIASLEKRFVDGPKDWGARATAEAAPAMPDDTRSLHYTMIIDAPLSEVWRAFTVAEEFESWAVPTSVIDLRVGGTNRTTYLPDKNVYGPDGIEHTYLAVEHEKLLASRITKSPMHSPIHRLLRNTWGVTRFEAVTPHKTRVIMTGHGYGHGPQWDQIVEIFNKGNEWTLAKLYEKFPPRTDLDERAHQLAAKLVGGEWVHENQFPNGEVFRVRNVAKQGPDERAVVIDGWLGNQEGMFYHAATSIFGDVDTGATRFISINERGDVTDGVMYVDPADAETLIWTWIPTSADETHYRVEMRFFDDKRYTMKLFNLGVSETAPEMTANFNRVDAAPPAFMRMRPSPAH